MADARRPRAFDVHEGSPVGSPFDHDARGSTAHRPKAGKAARPAGSVDARVNAGVPRTTTLHRRPRSRAGVFFWAALRAAFEGSKKSGEDRRTRNDMIVMKFGGTSVMDAEAIRRLAGIVAGRRQRTGAPPLVVVSAMSGVTDELLQLVDAAERREADVVDAEIPVLRDRHYRALH